MAARKPTAAGSKASSVTQVATPPSPSSATEGTVTGDGSGLALPPIAAIYVRTKRGISRRRRAGHVITPEGVCIALEGLSADQVKALKLDPCLTGEECTFPANDEDAS